MSRLKYILAIESKGLMKWRIDSKVTPTWIYAADVQKDKNIVVG